MGTTDRSVQFAGGTLGRQRHICAFFNSLDEEHRVLRSFIKDGLDRGEKAFHIVDPELREEHLKQLAAGDINVERAMGSGQLEVRLWQDCQFRGERFDQDAILSLIEEVLQSGAAAGYPLTRFLGHMEWALLNKPGLDDLAFVELETRVTDVLVGSLHLDFAFVRLCDPNGGAAVDVTRGNAWKAFPQWLQQHLAVIGQVSRKEFIPDVGGGVEPCRGIVIPIGVSAEGGLVAAACDRSDFPTEIDQLLLSVAANHAATAFQSARLIHERRRAEEELRQARDDLQLKVAGRTAELRRSEVYSAEAQRLSHTGSFGWKVSSGE